MLQTLVTDISLIKRERKVMTPLPPLSHPPPLPPTHALSSSLAFSLYHTMQHRRESVAAAACLLFDFSL